MQYLGMVEEMINQMIQQYAFYLAQGLKTQKNLDPNDPTIVTLNNILMVAPKTEQPKYELSFSINEMPQGVETDEKPLSKDELIMNVKKQKKTGMN